MMENFLFFLVVWAFAGGLIVPVLAKLFPNWETWKIVTTIVLGGPLLWLLIVIWFLFLEKG